MIEKFKNLEDEQKQELNALTTAGEVLDFARKMGIELTREEAAEIATRLPDDDLEAAAGGKTSVPIILPAIHVY